MADDRPALRADPRYPVAWKTAVRCRDWRTAEQVATVNASRGGMFVRTERRPAIGSAVELELGLPDGRRELLTGTVRHHGSEAAPGVGIEVDEGSRTLMRALAEIARIEQGLPPSTSDEAPAVPASAPARSEESRLASLKPDRAPEVGFDFGVTFCRAAVCTGTKAVMIPDAAGRVLLPSLVAFPEAAAPAVGWEALELQATCPERVLSSPKRLLGRAHADPFLEGMLQSLPLPHLAGPDGSVLLEVDGTPWAMPQICALLLGELRARAERVLGRTVEHAHFSHPLAYGEPYREALQRAAQLAGLEVTGFISEPVAGALGYGLGGARNEIVAVYDFGGGTFNFAIVDLSYGGHRVLASQGDEWLGGDDFDRTIAQAAADAYWRATKTELQGRAVEWAQLLRTAEAAKRELSRVEKARVSLGTLAAGRQALDLEIDRAALKRLCWPLFEQTLELCRAAFAEASLEPQDINQVVLSGGTTEIPFIQEALAEFFGRPIGPASGLEPAEAVALGTSRFAVVRSSPR